MFYVEITALSDIVYKELEIIPFSSIKRFIREKNFGGIEIEFLDGETELYEFGLYKIEVKSAENYPSIFGGDDE